MRNVCISSVIGVMLFLSSCVYQSTHISTMVQAEDYVPIFFCMPQSSFVFENIAPLVYEEMLGHFQRVGYDVASKLKDGYVLRTSIKKLEPYQKYVSPDILPFYVEIKLEIFCQLYDYSDKLVSEKSFYFSTLISKPRKPILTSSFLRYEHEKLLRRDIHQVEHFFRPFLQKNQKEEK